MLIDLVIQIQQWINEKIYFKAKMDYLLRKNDPLVHLKLGLILYRIKGAQTPPPLIKFISALSAFLCRTLCYFSTFDDIEQLERNIIYANLVVFSFLMHEQRF